jgi:hypothetical protein
MKNLKPHWFLTLALLVFFASSTLALVVAFEEKKEGDKQIFSLSNEQVICSVIFEEGKLSYDRLEAQADWVAEYRARPFR